MCYHLVENHLKFNSFLNAIAKPARINIIGGTLMTFKVIETFSGIGAQAKALERIKEKNPSFDYEIVATCEWEIGAAYAYDIIHHGKQNLDKYNQYNKDDLVQILSKYNLSSNGKEPMSPTALRHLDTQHLKAILHSIEKNNNLVDITQVHAEDLPDADMLTYSFPCQDLSISGFWWNNKSGIDPTSGNRSSLLWQIGRILTEYRILNKRLPKFLLMENVTQIESPMHADNFNQWKRLLREIGYTVNETFQLNARNFGVPQNRVRTFMVSVLGGENTTEIRDYLEQCGLEERLEDPNMDAFLRLDYSNSEYLQEALESIPNYTPSRREIHRKASVLAYGNILTGLTAKTITTKQDRHPTAGVIEHELSLEDETLAPYRNLTPRETFLLMGFDEKDFQTLKDINFELLPSRPLIGMGKFLKLTGNSIVVNVLEGIFSEINKIDEIYFKTNNIVPFQRNA